MKYATSRPRSLVRSGTCFVCRRAPRTVKSYCRPCLAARERAYRSKQGFSSSAVQDPAMSFQEIGLELGISTAGAWYAYCSGMKKISHQTEALQRMRELVEARST